MNTQTPTPTLSLRESNEYINRLVRADAPFFIARLSDIETKVALYGTNHPGAIAVLSNNAGIYTRSTSDIALYSRIYNDAVRNSTHIACFPSLYTHEQNHWLSTKGLTAGLDYRVLEPFYITEGGEGVEGAEVPWTHLFAGRRILIVSPFATTFERQVKSGFKFGNVFADGQEFVFYRAYNTQAGNHTHRNWFETFSVMCKDIAAIHATTPFDIALLSCGGYGLPLANYIYKRLGKSAMYVGGGLQLLFGVLGKRWENHTIIRRVSTTVPGWVRPAPEEVPTNSVSIEGGCYW